MDSSTWKALGVIAVLFAAMAVVLWAAFCPKHFVHQSPTPTPPVIVTVSPV